MDLYCTIPSLRTEAAFRSPLSPMVNSEKGLENARHPNEITTSPAGTPDLLPAQPNKAVQIFTWIKLSIQVQTHLPEALGSLIAFWVISTWFQESLTVLPCLIISGPAHDATLILRMLKDFCRGPALLAGFRRSDLARLNYGCQTMLISEPNLDKRAAALVGNLTNQEFHDHGRRFLGLVRQVKGYLYRRGPGVSNESSTPSASMSPQLMPTYQVVRNGCSRLSSTCHGALEAIS